MRFLALLLCLTLLAPAALADTKIPTRAVFCRGFDRLKDEIADGRAVNFTIRLQPGEMEGVSSGARAALSALWAEGTCWTKGVDGQMSLALCVGDETVLRVNQMRADGLTALDFGSGWLAADSAEGAERLSLDVLGALLLDFDYEALCEGQTPYFTPVYEAGQTLWRLASPYATDNNLLSTGSGATSHALTYKIKTSGMREIAAEFADALEAENLLLPGIPQEAIDAFVGKVRDIAENAELTKDIKANLTFGEGDILRTAKLSGTMKMNGRSAGISYNYNCGVSKTRLTRKYSLHYEPAEGDTISLTATWLTSSSGKGGAAHELSVSANGEYDGQPYSIRFSSETVNKYEGENNNRALTEYLTGSASVTIKYAGETVVSGSMTRAGEIFSTSSKENIVWNDVFNGSLAVRGREVYNGSVFLNVSLGENGAAPWIGEAVRVDMADDETIGAINDSLRALWHAAVVRIAAVLPEMIRYEISVSE